MIDAVSIFTKGGVVLWSYYFATVTATPFASSSKSDPIDFLIRNVFLEERTASTSTTGTSVDRFKLQWAVLNELGVVFVAVYEGLMQMNYIDKLLDSLKNEFTRLLPDELKGPGHRNMTKVQTELMQIMREQKKSFNQRFLSLLDKCDSMIDGKLGQQVLSPGEPRRRGGPSKKTDNEAEDGDKKPKKTPTTWMTQKVTKQKMSKLDFSKDTEGDPENRYIDNENEKTTSDRSDSETSEASAEDVAQSTTGFFGRISNALQNFTGNKVLTANDLDPILNEFKSLLMSKNVAVDVADSLVSSVKASLVGTKTESFTSVKYVLKQSLTEAMQRVLTQKKSVNVLRAANEAKEKGRIFSICFLGVNGVGKSTNLAKVAYYLKHKGQLKVMIAACDTFRAGAVEQLRTHARNLDVHLFEQGYGKDASIIAKNALKYASAEGYDVVLIDTAGRMQDNEPLMRGLAKLVALNSPDLVLFVGEALVGNDAIDQLVKFNRSLIDFAPPNVTNPRGIDGILLTKFDTVDDRIGAALSMTYISGQPVVFIGTGQKYTHLQTLKVNNVLKALIN